MNISIPSQSTILNALQVRAWARRPTRPADYVLASVVGVLLLIGVMMIYSVSVGPNLQVGSADPFSLVERHLTMLVAGIGAVILFTWLDYRLLMRYAVPLMVFTLVLLVGLLLFGEGVNGAKRWLLGPSIQPGEIAKLATIIYIAAWSASKGKKLRRILYGLVPFSILIGLIAGLIILQPNFSTAALIAIVAFLMFFMAGADLKQIAGALVVASGAAFLVVTQSARVAARMGLLWVDPKAELTDQTWQVIQTLVALASGGMFGKGLGTGGGQYGYVPLAHSDGIFAIWGEETGLIGAVLLVALFTFLAWRGFRVAREASDDFGRVLAAGITVWLVLQAFINMGVVTQLIPFTGQPLPFISYGGSSLIVCLAAIGILLSISRTLPKPAVVKSVPVGAGGGAPARALKENEFTSKKYASLDHRGGDRRTRLPARRRAAASRRRGHADDE